MLPEDLRETGSDDILFRDDQNAVNAFTPFRMKAGSRRDAGFLSDDVLSIHDHIIRSAS